VSHLPDMIATDLAVLLHALLAVVLGGAVGAERELRGKGAGLRTSMLVCLAAFLFTTIGILLTSDAAAALAPGLVEADPVRIVQAIVIGISFLGAGVIIRDPSDERVHGLTSAATLLVVAPVGVAVAMNRYVLAVGITLLVLLILRGVRQFENRYLRN
jgi:putative Mg2+ transporter-C (MgtC) family protein